MSIAEKFYREFNKIPAGTKFEKEDWRLLNILIRFHNHLLTKGKKYLSPGQIAVDKYRLIAHLATQKQFIAAMDEIMKEPSSVERGKKIGKALNALSNTICALEYFDLNIPMQKLPGKPIKVIGNKLFS